MTIMDILNKPIKELFAWAFVLAFIAAVVLMVLQLPGDAKRIEQENKAHDEYISGTYKQNMEQWEKSHPAK